MCVSLGEYCRCGAGVYHSYCLLYDINPGPGVQELDQVRLILLLLLHVIQGGTPIHQPSYFSITSEDHSRHRQKDHTIYSSEVNFLNSVLHIWYWKMGETQMGCYNNGPRPIHPRIMYFDKLFFPLCTWRAPFPLVYLTSSFSPYVALATESGSDERCYSGPIRFSMAQNVELRLCILGQNGWVNTF